MSYIIAQYITKAQNESHAQKHIYYYSIQVIIGELLKLLVIILFFWSLGVLKEGLICAIVFASIRIFSGGLHSDSQVKCIITTLFIIGSVILLSNVVIHIHSITVNILIFVLIFYITLKNAPLDHPNKPIISQEHRKKLKIRTILMNSIWFITSSLFLIAEHSSYIALTIALSALAEAFTLIKWSNIKLQFK